MASGSASTSNWDGDGSGSLRLLIQRGGASTKVRKRAALSGSLQSAGTPSICVGRYRQLFSVIAFFAPKRTQVEAQPQGFDPG